MTDRDHNLLHDGTYREPSDPLYREELIRALCPFCGAAAGPAFDGPLVRPRVECDNPACKAVMFGPTLDWAVRKWNARVWQPEPEPEPAPAPNPALVSRTALQEIEDRLRKEVVSELAVLLRKALDSLIPGQRDPR